MADFRLLVSRIATAHLQDMLVAAGPRLRDAVAAAVLRAEGAQRPLSWGSDRTDDRGGGRGTNGAEKDAAGEADARTSRAGQEVAMRALVPPLARVLASVAREHSENVRNDRPGVGRGGGAAKGGRLAARLAAKQAKAGGKGVGTMSAGLGAEPVPSRIGTGAHGGGFGGGRSGGWGSGRGGGRYRKWSAAGAFVDAAASWLETVADADDEGEEGGGRGVGPVRSLADVVLRRVASHAADRAQQRRIETDYRTADAARLALLEPEAPFGPANNDDDDSTENPLAAHRHQGQDARLKKKTKTWISRRGSAGSVDSSDDDNDEAADDSHDDGAVQEALLRDRMAYFIIGNLARLRAELKDRGLLRRRKGKKAKPQDQSINVATVVRALQVCAACTYPAPELAKIISNAVAIDDGNLVGLPESPGKAARGGGMLAAVLGKKKPAGGGAANFMTKFEKRRRKKKWVERQADKENRAGDVSSFIDAGDMWARPVDLWTLEAQLDEYLMVMS